MPPRRVVASPEYIQYAGDAPPCDAPHRTPRGTAHYPNVEKPKEFNAVLTDFLHSL
ncbi:hypothetical protein OHS71_20475 [Streptomyces sp. NBC_00377]|uniref:hypothetical protein n=1 Tax=unclassified Streptomyces TaxID=2593676 RepID=UPI002E1EA751|nr:MULTISPECIES: hypothetical protein [unclassified Streptomyces]